MAAQNADTSLLETLLPGDVFVNSRRMIRTRWAAGAMVLLATAFCVHVLRLPLPELRLYAIALVILAYNTLLAWLARRVSDHRRTAAPPGAASSPRAIRQMQRLVVWQVALDWLSMGIFLHLTGGIASPGIPFFLIHMLMVTILLPGQSPYIYVTMGVLILALISVLEWAGVLPHYTVIPHLPLDLHRSPIFVGSQLAFITITAFAVVYLTAAIMARLRQREHQVEALFRTTDAVTSTLDLDDVLHRLAESAAQAMSVTRSAIRLLDESGERLTIAAYCGLSEDYVSKAPIGLSRSAIDQEAVHGRPVIIDNAPQDPRIQYPDKVASERIFSILIVPLIGPGGRPLGVMRIYSGRVGRFTAEDADFALAIARQGAIAIENALAHNALQQADQARAQFVRIVTHELRSPTSGAQSLIRTLLHGLAGDLTDRQQDILQRIEHRLDALADLINDLLALAASKTPELQAPPDRLPLQPAISRVVDRLAAQAEEKGVALSCSLPEEPLIVTGTEEGLERIFENLIGNAIKYTPPGRSVSVTVSARDQEVLVSVADTGIGIPADEISHLWDEFFRASNVRTSSITGTGLGLSIVKRLVESYGGLIGVSSVEGEGSTFHVTLPLVVEAEEEPDPAG